MSDLKWKDAAELTGIAAIVGSLIFVGLQMQQQQKIAIAAQYQERYSTIMDFWIARQASDIERPRLGQSIIDRYGLPAGQDTETSADEIGSRYLWTRMTLAIWDNLHFQHESGFLTDEAWSAYETQMANNFRDPFFQYVIVNNRDAYRRSFIESFEKHNNNRD